MRTTLTLDDDVAARLARVMEKRRQTLKAVVNDAIRAGLETLDKARPAAKRHRIRPVHLGPSWYLETQAVTFAPGDKVEVTGSRVTYQGQPTIIAAEVKKDGQVLKLRDAAGIPVWAGQGRRR